MIRRETDKGWIIINQHDHAGLAGRLMSFWGNSTFTEPLPSDDVLFAISEHDAGWIEWDSNPKINNNTGYPANFMEMSNHEQCIIWRKCYSKHALSHPYSSSLIALHFSKFNKKAISKNSSNGEAKILQADMKDFVSDHLGISFSDSDFSELPTGVAVNLRLLQVGDIISLALCHGWLEFEIEDVPLDYDGNSVSIKLSSENGYNYLIDPYPFNKSNIELSVESQILTSKIFRDDSEYRQAVSNSESRNLWFTVYEA